MATKLDAFAAAYVECALWSSTDNADESGGEPLDANYDASDLAPEAVQACIEDCRDFREANAGLLAGIDDEQAGHDFWLTRNQHGAGFWDRGLGEVGRKLTDAAHVYGEVSLYVGDDGLIYVA